KRKYYLIKKSNNIILYYLMNGICQLLREYKEPNYQYYCISTCLFIPEKYYRYKANGTINDVKIKKLISFKNNLNQQLKNILNLPKEYILRIYYDDSISTDTEWYNYLNSLRKYDKI